MGRVLESYEYPNFFLVQIFERRNNILFYIIWPNNNKHKYINIMNKSNGKYPCCSTSYVNCKPIPSNFKYQRR